MMRRAGLLALAFAGAVQAAPCDRGCLQALADRVLDSMAAGDASTLPLAQPYAATENSVPSAPVMMAAWRSVSAAPRRFYAIDAVSQQVFIVASVDEGARPTLLWGRLRAAGGRLAEIELYENRSRGQGGYQFGGEGPANFPAAWTAAVAADRLPSRHVLLGHGRAIFDSRRRALPAAPGCVLMENGKVVEEHPEVAAEVAGGAAPPAGETKRVNIPCGLPPQRPTDAKARTEIVDELQGIVVSQGVVHGVAEPMIVTTPAESAFVPEQILAPYAAMLKKQQASGRYGAPALKPMPASAAAAEVHRVYDGQVQGQLLLVNLGAPGSRSPWAP